MGCLSHGMSPPPDLAVGTVGHFPTLLGIFKSVDIKGLVFEATPEWPWSQTLHRDICVVCSAEGTWALPSSRASVQVSRTESAIFRTRCAGHGPGTVRP